MNAQRDRAERGARPVPIEGSEPRRGPSAPAAVASVVALCDRSGRLIPAPGSAARSWDDFAWPPAVARAVARLGREVAESGAARVEEVRVEGEGPGAAGLAFECALAPIPVTVPAPAPGGPAVVATVRDVSAARSAEEALRESERRFRLLAENATDMISRHDPSGVYLYASPAARPVLGYDPAELVGRSAYDFIHPLDLAEVHRVHSTVLDTADLFTLAFRVRRRDGGFVWLETTTLAVRDPETGKVSEIQCSSRDITLRKHAEQELREHRELIQAVLDHGPAVVAIKDMAGRYVLVSRRFEEVSGLSRQAVLGRTDRSVFSREQVEAVHKAERAALERGGPVESEEVFEGPAGRRTFLVVRFPLLGHDGQPYALCAIGTDISPRREAEETLRLQNARLEDVARSERLAHETLKQAEVQLVQAEKLTALGQMVAGVAHEINNPLAFVNNNVAVLQRDLAHLRNLVLLYQQAHPALEAHAPEVLGRVRAHSEEVDIPYVLDNLDRLTTRSREGLRRIQQIVKDLREFARLDDGDLQAADLNAGVASTVNIIAGRAGKQEVELVTDLHPLPRVTCYPGKVNQVVMNLLANAIDACPAGGRVTVSTEAEPDGSGVVLRVRDTGSGIPPEIRDRIFDPFFTTKPVGQGTGLGLSISYGIVQAHSGTIAVESEPGRGSTFTVRLPLTPPLVALPAPR